MWNSLNENNTHKKQPTRIPILTNFHTQTCIVLEANYYPNDSYPGVSAYLREKLIPLHEYDCRFSGHQVYSKGFWFVLMGVQFPTVSIDSFVLWRTLHFYANILHGVNLEL